MFYRNCLFSLHTIKKYIFINLEDFPTGSWLGDDSNVEMRVRCGITPRYQYTHTKWKLHFYNEIYFAWGEKHTNTSQCKWNSIICKDVDFIIWGV